MGSRWLIRRFRTGPQSEPRGHVSSTRSPVARVRLASEGVRSVPPVTPALHSGAEDSRAAERQRPSGRGPRARERRLQARLAQQPTPTVPTAAAGARRAFRGTRVVARRNALSSSSSSTTPSGPARPFRLARVPRPGMTNTDVRRGTHPGDRTVCRPVSVRAIVRIGPGSDSDRYTEPFALLRRTGLRHVALPEVNEIGCPRSRRALVAATDLVPVRGTAHSIGCSVEGG